VDFDDPEYGVKEEDKDIVKVGLHERMLRMGDAKELGGK
jgi:hypothetical protein